MLRPATISDLKSLTALENISFSTDRLSRRNFRHIISHGNAETWVFEENSKVLGYTIVLFNSGTSLARLYSIAVHPEARGRHLGELLVDKSEDVAKEQDCVAIRLEVRVDNKPAEELYKKKGYKKIGVVKDYYEDHTNAYRYEKHLAPHQNLSLEKVPYYEQTLDFTCGPSALLMAMAALNKNVELNRTNELRIWREATTIFMTSGHGGCGPYGLSLSAYKRGYDVEIYVNGQGAMFLDSVRNPEKKEVMRLVQEDFRYEISKLPIKVHYRSLHVSEIMEKFSQGGIPLVLISSYRIYREKFPHWVVITGFDDKYIFCHDSYVDYEKHRSQTDCINMPILQKDFERMAVYGKSGQKAVLILYTRANSNESTSF
jgi:ribosomal-protein-alanine acetyltransferase